MAVNVQRQSDRPVPHHLLQRLNVRSEMDEPGATGVLQSMEVNHSPLAVGC
jgi:hypothetical protein